VRRDVAQLVRPRVLVLHGLHLAADEWRRDELVDGHLGGLGVLRDVRDLGQAAADAKQ